MSRDERMANCWSSKVTASTFLGSYSEERIEVGGQTLLRWSANKSPTHRQDLIWVSVSPADVRILGARTTRRKQHRIWEVRMTRLRKYFCVFAAATAMLTLASVEGVRAQGAAPLSASLETLYTEAKKEGRVVLYAATAEPAVNRTLALFKQKYPGIAVEFTRLNSGAISQRFSAEKGANAPTADVISNTAIAFQLDAFKKGWLTPLDATNIPGFPGEFPASDVHPQLGPILARHLSITSYNKKLVSEDQAPKTWEDLVDPKWKGKILMLDPREAEYLNMVLGGLISLLGEDWAKRLSQQNLRYVAGGAVPTTEILGAGEAALLPFNNGGIVKAAVNAGAPLAFTVPNPQTGPATLIALNAKAARPNAARLLIHFMMSEAGSRASFVPEEGVATPYTREVMGVKFLPVEPKYLTPEWRKRINDLLGLK